MADEIKLVSDTLAWLNTLRDEELPEQIRPKMRDLVANACDFQFGFSLPLDLGLSSHSRASQPLPIVRPIEPLLRWKYAFEVEPSQIESFEASDHEKVGDRVYCLVGGPTWESQVSKGAIEGEGAEEPNLNTSDWMLDLFDIFGRAADSADAKSKATARRLAACWYNVAMVVSFDKVEDDAMVGLSKEDVMAMMMGGINLGGDEEYEEYEEMDEEDIDTADAPNGATLIEKLMKGEIEDDEEDDDYDPAKDTKDNGLDEDIDEEDEEDDDSPTKDAAPKNASTKAAPKDAEPQEDYVTKRKQLAAALISGQLNDDDDDEDYDPEKDSNDDGEDDEEIEEDEEDDGSPVIIDDEADADENADEEEDEEEDEETRQKRAIEFRTRILAVIDKLGAQWPNVQDQAWLKRVLKLMSIADEQEKDWFPWGLPALDPLVKGAQSADELEKEHALSILALYQQRQEAASAPQ